MNDKKPLQQTFGLTLLMVLLTGCGATSSPMATPPSVNFQVVTEAVSGAIYDPLLQKYVLCHLQSGLWGEYDIEVQVSQGMTIDGNSRIFRIKRGQFSEEKAPVNTSSVTANWNGNVIIDNQEEAFSKGVPFFITNVAFETPDSLSYTVVSNPKTQVDGAFPMIEGNEGGIHSTAADIPHTFSSDAQPKELPLHFNLKDDASLTKGVLSIVTIIKGSNYCLVSNQVDLSTLKH